MNIKLLIPVLMLFLVVMFVQSSLSILPVENYTDPQNEITVPEVPLVEEQTLPTPIEKPLPVEEIPSSPTPSYFQTILSFLIDKINVIRGENINLEARLTYPNNTPLLGENIIFSANGKTIATQPTDHEGVAFYPWNTSPFAPGFYFVSANYSGDAVHEKSSQVKQIEIVSPSPITTAAVASAAVQEVESCSDSISYEEQTVMETCTIDLIKKICSDEPVNQSCTDEVKTVDYVCNPRQEMIPRTTRICRTTALVINNAVKINIEDYVCSTEEGTVITVLCDSKFDGNGDGTCSSGESCMRFTIDGSTVTKEEKNSRDDFVAEDEKYFLEEVKVEALQ